MNLELIRFDDPALRTPPSEFDFEKNDAKEYASNLTKRMIELGGVGLSANQVGLDMKVFCIGVRNPSTEEDFKRVLFNPVLVGVNDETSLVKEGCLSVPGLYLNVKRPTECTITYRNEDNEEKTERFLGIAARVALHEYDHMLGASFLNRVSKFKLDRALKSLNKKSKKILKQSELI